MTKTKTKHTFGSFQKILSQGIQQTSRPSLFDFLMPSTHLKQKHIRSQHGRPTTMFRAFALLTGSINIFSADLVIDIHNFRAYVDDNHLSSEL
jgi:hypothetical protein